MIRTVLRDLDEKSVVHAQCHEHLFVEKGKSFEVSPVLFMDDEEKTTRELLDYKQAGGSLIVDAQPGYFGRMAECLVRASSASGVDIVASTGFHKLVFCDFPEKMQKCAEELAEFFASEIEEGMLSSKKDGQRRLSARAGMIKTAVDKGGLHQSAEYETLFKAAALTQKRTGAPVLCHIEQGADALEVVDFFEENGVEPRKIIICHLDRARYDFEYHLKVAGRGVYFDYDSVNRLKYLSHDDELKLIMFMLENGFEDRLLLSLDTTSARLRAYGADMGLDYIPAVYRDMLLDYGVTIEQYFAMTRDNARRALAFG